MEDNEVAGRAGRPAPWLTSGEERITGDFVELRRDLEAQGLEEA
ncbi:MAG: hypothetical protein U5Q44_01770 [Dehalococcoidia bacterium]|nr:hypothetical protein [Dehalococcoidia bacterium]